jgi:hypothetical protein
MGAEFRYAPARQGCVDATGEFEPLENLAGPRSLSFFPGIGFYATIRASPHGE